MTAIYDQLEDDEPYDDIYYESGVDEEGPYDELEQESPFEDPTYVSPYGDLDWRVTDLGNVTRLSDHTPRLSDPATGPRTVTIQGRGAERNLPLPRARRPSPRRHERAGWRPDRVAMWAVMLGLLLVFVAATSAHP